MKKIIVLFAAIIVIGLALLYFAANMPFGGQSLTQNSDTQIIDQANRQNSDQNTEPPVVTPAESETATTSEPAAPTAEQKDQTVIGNSVNGADIVAYHFGTGEKEILLVGGIHGGYAWNTALLGYQMVDYLKANPAAVPANIKITIVPALNPDGLSKVVAVAGPFKISDASALPAARTAGRFNANNVDLNRNFDCNWKAAGVWQNKTVSGGTAAFSEPESAAIKNYAQEHKLTAVVAWYVSGGGVYASSCNNAILPETQTILDLYATASAYTAYKNFESYQVSGDMTDWFAKNNVPAISVLLKTAAGPEWEQNWAGVKAVLDNYAK